MVAAVVDDVKHHLGVEVQRLTVQGDQLGRVGRCLAGIGRCADGGRSGDAAEPDDIGCAGAADRAHADRAGGHAIGHAQIELRVAAHHIEAVVPAWIGHALRAEQHR